MTPDRPLWLAPVLVLIALAPMAWIGRQWLKEWRAYRAGTMLPRDYRPPEPPTLREPFRWRFLWLYGAQAGAIGGMVWIFLGRAEPTPPPLPEASQIFGALIAAVVLVAFTTAVLTRLWDRATLARRRGPAGDRQETPGEQVGIPAARGRLHQRP